MSSELASSTATIMDGRAVAKVISSEVAADLVRVEAEWRKRFGYYLPQPPPPTPLGAAASPAPPLLAIGVVVVGEDQTSASYIRILTRSCANVGLRCLLRSLPANAEQPQLEAEIRALNAAPDVIGTILQTPLPSHLNTARAVALLRPDKDIDGLHPLNAGRLAWGLPCLTPATPSGGLEMLRRHHITLEGKHAVVVGRSNVVGRPMSLLLLAANATVTTCHSHTPAIASYTRQADILIAAAGRTGLIKGDMVKPGAAVVDFGTNVQADGSLLGDVDFATVSQVAGYLSPVPGGTGPLTNMALIRNALTAARLQMGIANFVLYDSSL